MGKPRDLANVVATGNILADGAVAPAELTGVTSTAAEINILDGVTATAAELNLMDGVTATTAELNYVDGVTSAIQTQIDTKAPVADPTFTGTATAPTINASTALQIGGAAITATAAELNKMDGVTVSASDINSVTAKAPTSGPTFTGTVTIGGATYPTSDGSAGQVLTTNGSGAVSFADPAGGGSADFVASGAISNGDVVILNSNGTVTVATPESFSFSEGTAVNFSTQFDGGVGYDSTNNKIVVAWADESNNAYGSARVGTIDPSNNSVTFGSTAVFESAGVKVKHGSVAHDVANNKIVIVYKDEGNSNYGTAVVGTISGTSISFGTPVVYSSSNQTVNNIVQYSPTAEKVLIVYRDTGDSNKGKALVGTVSGTSISFGSAAQFDTSVNTVSLAYITTADKFCIYYQDNSASSKHTDAVIATISGTSVSFGSPNRISPSTSTSGEVPNYGRAVYDTKNDKMIFTWGETDNGGHAVVGTVSGTSVSVGSEVIFSSDPIDSDIGVVFDENVGKALIFYRETVGGTRVRKFIIGTVSGTSISFNTEASFGPNTNSTSKYTTVYDSGSKRVVIAYDDSSNSEIGYVTVFTVNGTVNRTVSNYIGVAAEAISDTATGSITINGGINEGQSSLAIGTTYYVSDVGVLQTTNNGRKIGKAISASKILVNSNMSGDEMNAYLGGLV